MFQGGFGFLLGLIMISIVINGNIEYYLKKKFNQDRDYKKDVYRISDCTNRLLFSAIIIIAFIHSFYITLDVHQVLMLLPSVFILGEIYFFYI